MFCNVSYLDPPYLATYCLRQFFNEFNNTWILIWGGLLLLEVKHFSSEFFFYFYRLV